MTQPLFPPSTPPRPVPAEVVGLRPTVVEVETAALAHNLRYLRARTGPSVRIQAVVKADAYGHGAVPCARAFVAAGADWLGVALVEEGVELRRAGLLVPVCVLSGIATPQDARVLVGYRLTPMVYRVDQLELVAAAARDAGLARYPVHLKLDTGMGRWGALPEDLPALMDRLAQLPSLELEGLATHFAHADSGDLAELAGPLQRFRALEQTLRARGWAPSLRHQCNSAALLCGGALGLGQGSGEMVRPGIALYGVDPLEGGDEDGDEDGGATPLRPALTLRTRVAHLKSVGAGFAVSYGGTFMTARPSVLATLPIGYADGLPRAASNRARVLVRGRVAPVVGRVCMDACVVDVTDVPGAALGDEVVLIGAQGGARLEAATLAEAAGTISYEILSGLGKRVPRVHR